MIQLELNLLGIKHYWAAFEFAAGRGQIHTHLLAITEHQSTILKEFYHLRNDSSSNAKQSNLISTYAKDVLELTANHPGYLNNEEYTKEDLKKHQFLPSLSKRYIETDNDIDDQQCLCHCTQLHYCNDFCMRQKKKKKG